jgi:signal transduction histidine kinase/ActR/RegA family two-component response regulator
MISAIVVLSGIMSTLLAAISLWAMRIEDGGHTLLIVLGTAVVTSFVVGTLGVSFADALIHRIKRMREELRAALATAELASCAKSDFLANMSHEIRTPLNGVLGMAQVLEATSLTPDQRDHLRVIRESGDVLITIIDDVLDLAKIEAGKTDLRPAPQALAAVLQGTIALFASRAAEQGTRLRFKPDADLPEAVVYDSVRVRQCLANLVSNAVKFTKDGNVDVTLAASPDVGGGWVIRITVQDTGIGISPEALDSLFHAFSQAGSATPGEFGGTGLGLAISRRLARMMGGDITVTSAPSAGSCFVFTFEALAVATGGPRVVVEPGGPTGGANLSGLRVLVVDDSAVNRRVVIGMLRPLGVVCAEAEHGGHALDALATAQFDLVLLDMHMPVMDGETTLKAMRLGSAPTSLTPVIALTADITSARPEQYIALGMQGFLPKPVRRADLCAKIADVVNVADHRGRS